MKATIDFDEHLYRRLKIEAARRGRTIRDLVDEGVRRVLGLHVPGADVETAEEPEWFGSLRGYGDASGGHELSTVRRSIAEKRRVQP